MMRVLIFIALLSFTALTAAVDTPLTIFGSGITNPLGLATDAQRHLLIASNGVPPSITNVSYASNAFISNVTFISAAPVLYGLAVDSTTGNILAATGIGNSIIRYSSAGAVLATYGGFSTPMDVAVDTSGNIYVPNNNGSVSKLTNGQVVGNFLSGASAVYGIALDSSANIYLTTSSSIVTMTSTGTNVVTHPLVSAAGPRGIKLDLYNNIIVADKSNDAVYFYNSTFNLTHTYTTSPTLNSPFAIAIDQVTNNIYVADSGNNRIVLFQTAATSSPATTTSSSSSSTSSSSSAGSVSSSSYSAVSSSSYSSSSSSGSAAVISSSSALSSSSTAKNSASNSMTHVIYYTVIALTLLVSMIMSTLL